MHIIDLTQEPMSFITPSRALGFIVNSLAGIYHFDLDSSMLLKVLD